MARVALRPLHSILEGAARAQQIQQARAYQQWRQQQQQWALQDRQRQEEERQRTEAARQALAGILAQRALQTQQNQPSEVGPPRTSIIPQSNFPGLSPTQPMQPPPQLITKTLAPQQTTLDPNIQALIQASPDAYLSLQQALAPKVPQAWPEAPYVMGEEGQPVPNIGAKPSITYSDPYVVDGVLVQKDSLGKIKRLGEIKTPKKQWAPPREFKPGSGIYIQTDPEDGRTYRVFSEGNYSFASV